MKALNHGKLSNFYFKSPTGLKKPPPPQPHASSDSVEGHRHHGWSSAVKGET